MVGLTQRTAAGLVHHTCSTLLGLPNPWHGASPAVVPSPVVMAPEPPSLADGRHEDVLGAFDAVLSWPPALGEEPDSHQEPDSSAVSRDAQPGPLPCPSDPVVSVDASPVRAEPAPATPSPRADARLPPEDYSGDAEGLSAVLLSRPSTPFLGWTPTFESTSLTRGLDRLPCLLDPEEHPWNFGRWR